MAAAAADPIKVTVVKETWDTATGIVFSKKKKTIVISKVTRNSLFDGTGLREGYQVVSINGIPCKQLYPEDCTEIVQEIEGELTLVVIPSVESDTAAITDNKHEALETSSLNLAQTENRNGHTEPKLAPPPTTKDVNGTTEPNLAEEESALNSASVNNSRDLSCSNIGLLKENGSTTAPMEGRKFQMTAMDSVVRADCYNATAVEPRRDSGQATEIPAKHSDLVNSKVSAKTTKRKHHSTNTEQEGMELKKAAPLEGRKFQSPAMVILADSYNVTGEEPRRDSGKALKSQAKRNDLVHSKVSAKTTKRKQQSTNTEEQDMELKKAAASRRTKVAQTRAPLEGRKSQSTAMNSVALANWYNATAEEPRSDSAKAPQIQAKQSDLVNSKVSAKTTTKRKPKQYTNTEQEDMELKRAAAGRRTKVAQTLAGAYGVASLPEVVDSAGMDEKPRGSGAPGAYGVASMPEEVMNSGGMDVKSRRRSGARLAGARAESEEFLNTEKSESSLKSNAQDYQVKPGARRISGPGEDIRPSYDSPRSVPRAVVHRANVTPAQHSDPVDLERNHLESFGADAVAHAYTVEEPDVVHEAEIVKDENKSKKLILIGICVLVLVLAIVVPVAVTSSNNGSDNSDSGPIEVVFSTIASGLCAPRHLKVHDDKLFVAESGIGPRDIEASSTQCLPSTLPFIPGGICIGNTGRVSTFDLDGKMEAIPLEGLFSARPRGGFENQVYGAASVEFDDDGNMFTLIGLGYVNGTNVSIQAPEMVFASVLLNDEPVASPWVPLYENNYAGVRIPETNPFHMTIHDGTTYVADAGADLLLTYFDVMNAGTEEADSVILLPRIENIPAVEPNPRGGPCNDVTPPRGPNFCGEYQDDAGNWLYSASAVPTVVRVNPENPNRIYVGYMVGAIWNEPVSGIFYMDLEDGVPQPDTIGTISGDFWAISDFAFYGDDIFVLETNPGGFVPFDGRLSRVTVNPDGSVANKEIITEDLLEPVGVIVHNDVLYLTNHTFSFDIGSCNGKIVKAPLK